MGLIIDKIKFESVDVTTTDATEHTEIIKLMRVHYRYFENKVEYPGCITLPYDPNVTILELYEMLRAESKSLKKQ